MDRVADCQMFPLSPLCVFDTQSEGRLERRRVGGVKS